MISKPWGWVTSASVVAVAVTFQVSSPGAFAEATFDVDLSDAVHTLNWLFLGGPAPGCVAAANTNGDDTVDLSDPVYLLSHLFLGGQPPVAPFPECGPGSPTDEEIGCETPPTCEQDG